MSDLVERLRGADRHSARVKLCQEAASELEEQTELIVNMSLILRKYWRGRFWDSMTQQEADEVNASLAKAKEYLFG